MEGVDGMSDAYIEQRDDAYVVAGSRVSLDSIVYAFLSGQSAEAIAQAFPVLSLEQQWVPHGVRRRSPPASTPMTPNVCA